MSDWDFETRAIHSSASAAGEGRQWGATSVPIYESAAFAYDSAEEIEEVFAGRRFGYLYSRIANPTVAAFERTMNSLEEGVGAIASSSGMAAIATIAFSLTRQGDEIVAGSSLFGGTLHLFNRVFGRYGVTTRYVDSTDPEQVRRAIGPKTRLVFVEIIGNPKVDVPDIAALSAITREHGIPLVTDATLATPYLFSAKQSGADISVHSATKYITGNGSTIGGVLVDLGTFDWKSYKDPVIEEAMGRVGRTFAFLAVARKHIHENIGGAQAPFNAYLHCLGLETLALRMERHCSNALSLARHLQDHGGVKSLSYPGLADDPSHEIAKRQFGDRYGALIGVRMGSRERAFRLVNALKLVKRMTNLGDAKTLIIHPGSTIYSTCTESEKLDAGVTDDLLRVSVGIESPRDIIADFDQALEEANNVA